MDHGGQVAHVHQGHKVPGLVQAVETLALDHRPERNILLSNGFLFVLFADNFYMVYLIYLGFTVMVIAY